MAGQLFDLGSEKIKNQIADYQKQNAVHAHHVSVSHLLKLVEENSAIVGFKIEHSYDENNVHNLVISGVDKTGAIASSSFISDVPPCPPDCDPTFA